MKLNIVDILIVISLCSYLVIGYFQGFIKVFVEIVGFVIALVISFAFYPQVAGFLAGNFDVPQSFANILGFFGIWMVIDGIYLVGASLLYNRFPKKFTDSKANKIGGIFASLGKAVVIIALLLTLIISLPVSGSVKSQVLSSGLAPIFVSKTTKYEANIQGLFWRALKDSLTYFTVKPEADEKVDLKFTQTNVTIDTKSEDEMLKLLNEERAKIGLRPLVMDARLQDLAREHSKDMFARGYFSHVNPDGENPFERMERFKIRYNHAGENLALAPTASMAHSGLMNSPGHKENILKPEYTKVGIGCIDGGPYGKMFSQKFLG